MYISEFWCGVFSTLLVEFAVLVLLSILMSKK